MSTSSLVLHNSGPLAGKVDLLGAKNAVLVIMASLILTRGVSTLTNVPFSEDVLYFIHILESLGAQIQQDRTQNILVIDTSNLINAPISAEIMRKMRASILVMGPLLARFGRADVALPGGCVLGARPINFHLQAFKKMGVQFTQHDDALLGECTHLEPAVHILEYPSVGATENIMMASILAKGTTRIVNAAIEPEVLDLIEALTKMGARITITAPATISITGVSEVHPIEHHLLYDRLEAGSLLLAAAITGGEIELPDAPHAFMEVFLAKLEEMGHHITRGPQGAGVSLKATTTPQAVSFKTMPYPGFPTDLQAPMMAALCLASGTSVVQETVYENRLVHVRELQKMGAQISVNGQTATIVGVDELYGASVIAPDIRAGAALVIAGLAAQGKTSITGLHHLKRGYDQLIPKLTSLGAQIEIVED